MRGWSWATRTAVITGVLGVLLAVAPTVYARTAWTATTVVSMSMEPGYKPHQQLVLDRISGADVHRGDVVLYRRPASWAAGGGAGLARVVALGGDRISQHGTGPVLLNGKPLVETYTMDNVPAAIDFDVVVPAGRMFVMGDHRNDSLDSRFNQETDSGTVPTSAVIARDEGTGFVPLVGVGIAALLGALLVLASIGFFITALALRRRGPKPPVVWLPAAGPAGETVQPELDSLN